MRFLGLLLALICLNFATVVGFSAAAKNTAKPVAKEEHDPPMTFLVVRDTSMICEPDCPQWISAQGRIMPDTHLKLSKFLQDVALRKLPLVLNSGGGSIPSAMAMGRILRKYKMDAAVGETVIIGCSRDDREFGKCKPDPVLHALDGIAAINRAYCGSACPLVLMGGLHRVVDPMSFIGLHEPTGSTQPYIDQYLIRYRMVHHQKQIISRTFVKRVYLAKKIVVGITPRLRMELTRYIREMGGSLDILVEMEKASPKEMNWISYSSRERERLGLVTANFRRLATLIGSEACVGKFSRPENCIHLKAKEPYVPKPFER